MTKLNICTLHKSYKNIKDRIIINYNRFNNSIRSYFKPPLNEDITLSDYIHDRDVEMYDLGIAMKVFRVLIMATPTTILATWPMSVATTTITLTTVVRSTSTSTTTRPTATTIIPVVSFPLRPVQNNSVITDFPKILKSLLRFISSLYTLCIVSGTFFLFSTKKTGIATV